MHLIPVIFLFLLSSEVNVLLSAAGPAPIIVEALTEQV